jgi:hypothetical protein
MDRKSVISEKENRVLAEFPRLFIHDGKADNLNIKNIPREMDGYINDRFGFRDVFVSLANHLNKTTKTTNGHVIIGKEGWLFYSRLDDGNNINDFFKLNLFTETEVQLFIENIQKRYEWCRNNGIEFIFLIAPNKHNVYPEYYPFERPEGITRTEQVMDALPDNLKDVVIYPLNYIKRNKTAAIPLYFETDTHWNMAGAYYAFDMLSARVKRLFPQTGFPELGFVTDISYDFSGDIPPHSGFTSFGKRTIPDVHPVGGWERYYHYEKQDGVYGVNGIIANNNNQSLPKAIIFRDSFFTALEPFTSSLFSSAEYNWRFFNEQEKKYIMENKPDIIIWEIVERYMAGIPYSKW